MKDGVDHINMYSKGKTRLGQALSNFAYSPIQTEDGWFCSIEAYWYWLGCTNPDKDKLKISWGYAAKQLGKQLRAKDWQNSENFKEKIKKAIIIKLEHFSPELHKKLVENKLPLKHYYLYGTKVINVPEAEWILDIIRNYVNEFNLSSISSRS